MASQFLSGFLIREGCVWYFGPGSTRQFYLLHLTRLLQRSLSWVQDAGIIEKYWSWKTRSCDVHVIDSGCWYRLLVSPQAPDQRRHTPQKPLSPQSLRNMPHSLARKWSTVSAVGRWCSPPLLLAKMLTPDSKYFPGILWYRVIKFPDIVGQIRWD